MSASVSIQNGSADVSSRIELQLECYRQKLAIIDDALRRTLALPFYRRPRALIAFLWKERAMYRFAIGEFEDLLKIR